MPPKPPRSAAGPLSRRKPPIKTKVLADNKVVIVQPTPALKKALQDIGATMAKEWESLRRRRMLAAIK